MQRIAVALMAAVGLLRMYLSKCRGEKWRGTWNAPVNSAREVWRL